MEERSFYYRYCIVIPSNYPKLYNYLEKSLNAFDFSVQSFDDNKSKYICISQNNEEKILKQAEILRIKKPKNIPIQEKDNSLLDKRIIDLEKKQYFISNEIPEYSPNKEYYDLYYDSIGQNKKDDKYNNNKRYGLGLFTESEMLYIEKSILENIPIDNIAEFEEVLSEIGKKNKNKLINENSLFDTLISFNIILYYFPLHISNISSKLIKKNKLPFDLLRCYLGDEMALYFYWLNHYTKFLSFPAIFSLLIFLFSKLLSNKNVEILHILYVSGIIIWIQFFIVFWRRKESELKVLWDNDSKVYEDEDKRKEFVGEIRKSIITGKNELFYPQKKKLFNYLISCCITLIFISIALFIHIIALNLRNLIPEENHKYLSKIRFDNFRKINLENSILSKIIVPVKNIILTIFGLIFDKVNICLTDFENHRTKTHYSNSYIIKKFIFESFNYFFDIFYLSFILNDLNETTNTIKSFLYLNEILRISSETIFPLIKNIIFTKSIKDRENYNEMRLISNKDIDKKEVLKQSRFKIFNSYYEYYPLILEFCFMTLFAFCVPFTPILLFITNNLEIRSDLIKVCFLTRRPEALKKKNIGAWKYILEFIGIASIITNVMFCYIYNNINGENKYSLLTFVTWEHALMLFIIILRFFLPSISGWVRLYKIRKFFKGKEISIKLEKNENFQKNKDEEIKIEEIKIEEIKEDEIKGNN